MTEACIDGTSRSAIARHSGKPSTVPAADSSSACDTMPASTIDSCV